MQQIQDFKKEWFEDCKHLWKAKVEVEVKVKLKVFSVSPQLQVKLDPNRQVANYENINRDSLTFDTWYGDKGSVKISIVCLDWTRYNRADCEKHESWVVSCVCWEDQTRYEVTWRPSLSLNRAELHSPPLLYHTQLEPASHWIFSTRH